MPEDKLLMLSAVTSPKDIYPATYVPNTLVTFSLTLLYKAGLFGIHFLVTNKFFKDMRVTFLLLLLLITGCSQKLTRQDVEDQISEAREEVQDAQEEVADAIEDREQFYEDYKESRLNELEERSETLDDKIKALKKTGKDTNENAQADIESAIEDFKEEQREIREKIKAVKKIEVKDWSEAYEELDEAVSDISRQLDQLANSLNETEASD